MTIIELKLIELLKHFFYSYKQFSPLFFIQRSIYNDDLYMLNA